MSTTITVVLWAIGHGYVTAGILASCYRFCTTQPMSFRLLTEGGPAGALIALPLLALTGPAVIARNAWRGRTIEGRAWAWLAASLLLVSVWSFLIGLYVLDIVIRVHLALFT